MMIGLKLPSRSLRPSLTHARKTAHLTLSRKPGKYKSGTGKRERQNPTGPRSANTCVVNFQNGRRNLRTSTFVQRKRHVPNRRDVGVLNGRVLLVVATLA